MTTSDDAVVGRGTQADDYSQTYYAGHLGGQDYGWESDAWREFFVRVATRVEAITSARSVLDVGCARGLFVQALRQVGVDARGFDVSDHAVTSSHPDVRDHLWVQSATAPIEGRYDLVSCIEVLEHMAPDEADLAIDRMCAATDHVLFSSSPTDFAEPTHVNVRPTAEWVSAFAERGFFRRTDVALDFLTGWAVLLTRQTLTPRDVASLYEHQYATVHTEVLEKRTGLLEAHRDLARLHGRINDPDAEVRLERSRAAQLEAVSHAEAEVVRARQEIELLRANVQSLEQLSASLQAQLARSDKRARRLSGRLTTSRKRARAQVRKHRKQLRRTRRHLAEQRVRAESAEDRLGELRSTRTYRMATGLAAPGRLWTRMTRSRRGREQDGRAMP